nr:MAG TPA: hypothetical protein [Caudoviricetes sp.]
MEVRPLHRAPGPHRPLTTTEHSDPGCNQGERENTTMRKPSHGYRTGLRPRWFNPANVNEAGRHRPATAPNPVLVRDLLAHVGVAA